MKIFAMYIEEADSLIPKSGTGWGYFGSELEKKIGYKGDIHLFIHWGKMRTAGRGWCSMTLSDAQPHGERSWHIPWGSTFLTRRAAVKTLARSLQLIDILSHYPEE